eukprot:13553199-Ditylum_brightwellii.AAC.1
MSTSAKRPRASLLAKANFPTKQTKRSAPKKTPQQKRKTPLSPSKDLDQIDSNKRCPYVMVVQ